MLYTAAQNGVRVWSSPILLSPSRPSASSVTGFHSAVDIWGKIILCHGEESGT